VFNNYIGLFLLQIKDIPGGFTCHFVPNIRPFVPFLWCTSDFNEKEDFLTFIIFLLLICINLKKLTL